MADHKNEYDDDKNTHLHYAAARNKINDVVDTLKNRHKIDPENYLGWTPLMMAARNGNLDVVQLLIDHKADATRKNMFGASVFMAAIASGNTDVIHLILQHLLCGGISKQSLETTLSPLVIALLFEQEEVVQYLLSNSFNVNVVTDRTGITPIMISAIKENVSLFQLLVSKGADPFLKNINNQSAQDIMLSKQQQKEAAQQMSHHHHHHHHHQGHTQRNNQRHHSISTQLPHAQVVYLSPQPTFINLPVPNQYPVRKSSNISTPCYILSPNLSPIPGQVLGFQPHHAHAHQVFFGADFNAQQFLSPLLSSGGHNQNVFLAPTSAMGSYMCPPANNSAYNQSAYMTPTSPMENYMANSGHNKNVFFSPAPLIENCTCPPTTNNSAHNTANFNDVMPNMPYQKQ